MGHEEIERKIYLIRGHRVMLDSDLADLYGVRTKHLNQQVRRNRERFPDDFMFELTTAEARDLRLQIATPSWGGRRFLPAVFTEHGVAMLSSVLSSSRAIQANIEIMRAFIKLRRCVAASPGLAERIQQVESRLNGQQAVLGEHAQSIKEVFADIRKLMEPPAKRKRRRSATWLRVVTAVRRPPREG